MANSGQKVVLITGCSSGIGLRIAVTLAKDEKKRYHGKTRVLLHCFFDRSELVTLFRVYSTPLFSHLLCCTKTFLYAQGSLEVSCATLKKK